MCKNRIQLSTRDPFVTKYKRDVTMSWITWIANTGGLMGLCMGMSFVSIAEIVYYFGKLVVTRCCRFGKGGEEVGKDNEKDGGGNKGGRMEWMRRVTGCSPLVCCSLRC